MPFSVYVAKPPAGGGYDPHIYKVGKTTEEYVQSRIAALNDAGSNYPTANAENWVLVDHFRFAHQEQMDAFESAMAANLGTGLDPLGTGATELFESAALVADVRDAARAAVKTLVENDLVDVGAVANLAAEQGTTATATAAAQLRPSTEDLPEDAVELIVEVVLELLPVAFPALGIGLALWRGKRIYSWLRGEWEEALERARSAGPRRPMEPSEVTEARTALKQAREAMESRQQSK